MSELDGRAHANGLAIAALAEMLAELAGPGGLRLVEARITRLLPSAIDGAQANGNADLRRGLEEQMAFILGCLREQQGPA
jgi:hypothetical protein